MSFFFNKSDGKDNLQYDDTAFLHFAISACAVTSIVFTGLIIQDIRQNRKSKKEFEELKKIPFMKERVIKEEKKQKGYFSTSSFWFKLFILVISVLSGVLAWGNISQDSKMIGFDPYEILGVDMDAPVNTIKKAYRKLALEFHPDRNIHNPEAAAKFIQISKAYECLTDEEAK